MAQSDAAATLERASSALDALIYDVRLGIRSPAHFDALEARASAIADLIRSSQKTVNSAHRHTLPKLTTRVRFPSPAPRFSAIFW